MIWPQTLKRGTLVRAGKNRLKLCGDATWEGIFRSIAHQWCGQSRRTLLRRDCFLDSHWTPIELPLDAGVDASKNPPFWTDATKIREEPLTMEPQRDERGPMLVSTTNWERSVGYDRVACVLRILQHLMHVVELSLRNAGGYLVQPSAGILQLLGNRHCILSADGGP